MNMSGHCLWPGPSYRASQGEIAEIAPASSVPAWSPCRVLPLQQAPWISKWVSPDHGPGVFNLQHSLWILGWAGWRPLPPLSVYDPPGPNPAGFKPDLGYLSAASPQGQGAWNGTWSFTPPGYVAQFWVPPSRGPSTWRGPGPGWALASPLLEAALASPCGGVPLALISSQTEISPHAPKSCPWEKRVQGLPAPPPQTYSYDFRSYLGNFTPNLKVKWLIFFKYLYDLWFNFFFVCLFSDLLIQNTDYSLQHNFLVSSCC